LFNNTTQKRPFQIQSEMLNRIILNC